MIAAVAAAVLALRLMPGSTAGDVAASIPHDLASPHEGEGEPAWVAFDVPAPRVGTRPMVAVVLDDLGPNRAATEAAIALPAAVTLAFLPYASGVEAQVEAARGRGHEILVHLPMEAVDPRADTGPGALLTSLAPDEMRRRLRWNFDRFGGYVGFSNHMGSRFTASEDAMRLVLGEAKARGLLFLDSRTSADTVAATVARAMKVPTLERDVFLDNERAAGAVAARLAEAEALARRRGFAVAIGHPHPGTIEALRHWLAGLEARGLAAVPVSAVVREGRGAETSLR